MSATASKRAVFIQDGELVRATELARGPWDPGAQHGGAAAALLMREFERLDGPGLTLARVTYEFLRPVPLGRLEVDADVVRPGKRVQLLEGAIRAPNGIEVVRARALRIAPADPQVPRTDSQPIPPGPETGRPNTLRSPHRPMFAPDAIELKFVRGTFHDAGPATAWFRLNVPIVAGEEPSPLQRLAAAGDFGNGISSILSWDEYMFINPDLTLYIDREPAGEWIALESRTYIAPEGVGTAESVLYDKDGRVGRATQSLLIAPR
jgi:Acyl-CoA thioesterase C-terminal domain/Acyl-CoA thioesterase N-terminal domain